MEIVKLVVKDNDTGNYPMKRCVAIYTFSNGKEKRVYFGQKNSQGTYYDKKNPVKRFAYIARHQNAGENWNKTGAFTPGFLSRYILWEYNPKPILQKLLGINNITIDIKRMV